MAKIGDQNPGREERQQSSCVSWRSNGIDKNWPQWLPWSCLEAVQPPSLVPGAYLTTPLHPGDFYTYLGRGSSFVPQGRHGKNDPNSLGSLFNLFSGSDQGVIDEERGNTIQEQETACAKFQWRGEASYMWELCVA